MVPGMTGGAILIVLDIYGQFVDAVGNLATSKARRREYLLFLGALGLGAAIAMVGLSRAVTWLLDWRPVLPTFFFKGLLLGAIPPLFRLHSDMRIARGWALAALLGLALVVALRTLQQQNTLLLAVCLAADIGIAALLGRRGAEGRAGIGRVLRSPREPSPQCVDGEAGIYSGRRRMVRARRTLWIIIAGGNHDIEYTWCDGRRMWHGKVRTS